MHDRRSTRLLCQLQTRIAERLAFRELRTASKKAVVVSRKAIGLADFFNPNSVLASNFVQLVACRAFRCWPALAIGIPPSSGPTTGPTTPLRPVSLTATSL